jgi:TolA-binding protein
MSAFQSISEMKRRIMKNRSVVSLFSAALISACMFFACTSTMENTQEDTFFDPLKNNLRKKSTPSQNTSIEKRSESGMTDSTNGEILQILREQNEQLSDVTRQLSKLTKKEVNESSGKMDLVHEMLSTRDKFSNGILVEMIRNQNQRLNDVVGQLKLLAENQQYEQKKNLAEIPSEPGHESFFSSPAEYDVSYGYGHAVQLYQQKKYKKAIQGFQALLDAGIDTALQDNCHFWKGVSCFQLNRIHQAMAEFTKVLRIADSEKMEGAYFMMGQCYEKRGEKMRAKRIFEKMLRAYPDGSLKQVTEIKIALLK